MSAVINKSRLNNFANQIWKSAQRLRGKFKGYKYQNVIMPMIIIRLKGSFIKGSLSRDKTTHRQKIIIIATLTTVRLSSTKSRLKPICKEGPTETTITLSQFSLK